MERLTRDLKGIGEDIRNNDVDYILVIEGEERSGKSSLAVQACSIVDPNFNEDKIVFTMAELKEQVRNSKKGDAILVDEGAILLYRRNAMAKEQREILQIIQVIGQYNLFICICIPALTSLEKYIVEHRIKGLLRVTKRGRFFAYNKKKCMKIRKSKFSHKLYYPRPMYKESYRDAKNVVPDIWAAYLRKKKKILDREQFDKEDVTPDKIDLLIKENQKWCAATKAARIGHTNPVTIWQRGRDGIIRTKLSASRVKLYYIPDILDLCVEKAKIIRK